MKLKTVIHYPDTNSVEATWVEVVTLPQQEISEGVADLTLRTQEVQVRCHSYHETQMDMLEADLGADLPEYTALIATVRAAIHVPTPEELAAQLVAVKAAKNLQITLWRAAENQSYFTYAGKQIACDALSRSDIDAVANSIALTGGFPAGFPNAWKAMDNSYVAIPDVDTFKALHAAMTDQGTVNFGRSQTLKAALAAATTVEQIDAIVW